MSRPKRHVKAGDIVEVLSGADRGKSGKVMQLVNGGERALVENLNLQKKHQKPTQDQPEGRIVEREGSIHISSLRVLEAADAKAEKKKQKKEKEKSDEE